MARIKIIPSLAAAPLTRLADTVRELEQSGADMLHFDIEDGCFVPMLTLGVKIIAELRPLTKLPFDVHLMVQDPEWLIRPLAEMGIDMLSVHYEACPYPRRTLALIDQHHIQAGLAFNPRTPIPDLGFCLPFLRFILVLSTEPEEGPWTYLPDVVKKISSGRAQPALRNVRWFIDGGVSAENIHAIAAAGYDGAVCGRSVFKDGHVAQNLAAIKQAAETSPLS